MNLNLRRRIHVYELFNVLVSLTLFAAVMFTVSLSTAQSSAEQLTIFSFGLQAIVAIYIVAFVVFVIYNLLLNYLLKKRSKNAAVAALNRGMQPLFTVPLSISLLRLTHQKYDVHQRNNFSTIDWAYCDFQFSKFRRSKYRYHRAQTYYYAVAMFWLPRKLPNVFFDSKSTGSREFMLQFKSSQKHSLEGDFDKYFKTYFHEDYKIDNLSFITPEVMHALIAAKSYDIEIFEDKLYLYNELESMPQQLEDMERLGRNIRDKLLHNIKTYRDERIKFEEGRRTVSIKGVLLLRSISREYAALVGSIAAFCFSAYLYISGTVQGIAIYAMIISAGNIVRMIITIHDIRKYEKLRDTYKHIGA